MNTNARPECPPLPRISVVTPSFNQSPYIESTLRSVLDQHYPDLEYIVIDGGSTDGSVDIIRRHEQQLSGWVSEKDGGQYDALNKGFALSTGEIMAWINSDDVYFPWTLALVGHLFSKYPHVEWMTTMYPSTMNREGVPTCFGQVPAYGRSLFLRGGYIGEGGRPGAGYIMQEATFWRRRLWDRAGGKLNVEYSLAGDFDLWARFIQSAALYSVRAPMACFRMHGDQRSAIHLDEYQAQAFASLRANGGCPWNMFDRLARGLRLGRIWPLTVMPCLGIVEVAKQLRHDGTEWVEREVVVTGAG